MGDNSATVRILPQVPPEETQSIAVVPGIPTGKPTKLPVFAALMFAWSATAVEESVQVGCFILLLSSGAGIVDRFSLGLLQWNKSENNWLKRSSKRFVANLSRKHRISGFWSAALSSQ